MSRLRDGLARQLDSHRLTRKSLDWYAFHRSRMHVVSYPKSGRTWLRFGLGVALREHFRLQIENPADLLEINRLARIDRRVPSIRFSHDDDPHTKRSTELERSKRAYRAKDVVLLVRDPRDVVVSSYHQHTQRSPSFGDLTFVGPIADFIRDPVFGVATIIEFLNIWAQSRSIPSRFALIRYEDMSRDFEHELRRLLAFVGIIDPDGEAICRATEAAAFQNMRTLEREDVLGAGRLRSADPNDPASFKVRKGRVGGFVEELEPRDREYVDAAMASLDPYFGYEIS